MATSNNEQTLTKSRLQKDTTNGKLFSSFLSYFMKLKLVNSFRLITNVMLIFSALQCR